MADASVLGITPPATVRVDLDGWVQDWPWETVEVGGDELIISVPLANGRRRVVFYPYEHATQTGLDPNSPFLPDRSDLVEWVFHGRQDFTVSAGPPQAPSLN